MKHSWWPNLQQVSVNLTVSRTYSSCFLHAIVEKYFHILYIFSQIFKCFVLICPFSEKPHAILLLSRIGPGLHVTSNTEGLLLYATVNLPPSKLIHFDHFPNEIQCILIELNISHKKYALLSIYWPSNQNINYFLDKLLEALDI